MTYKVNYFGRGDNRVYVISLYNYKEHKLLDFSVDKNFSTLACTETKEEINDAPWEVVEIVSRETFDCTELKFIDLILNAEDGAASLSESFVEGLRRMRSRLTRGETILASFKSIAQQYPVQAREFLRHCISGQFYPKYSSELLHVMKTHKREFLILAEVLKQDPVGFRAVIQLAIENIGDVAPAIPRLRCMSFVQI